MEGVERQAKREVPEETNKKSSKRRRRGKQKSEKSPPTISIENAGSSQPSGEQARGSNEEASKGKPRKNWAKSNTTKSDRYTGPSRKV